ncbi:MAG: glycosyltransferase family 4 protein [Candidatus Gastranaerophilales bacterium]|nr:glycosyltransferase family 4 protein [Candidatus Gastranaerophilales bacterium]
MNKQRIAFVTKIYTDSNFKSGGVKLNFLLLEKLYNYGYSIDLFTSKNTKINHNIFNNIYSIDEFNNLKENYEIILSDKAVVPSNITYIHDHSYPYRVTKMSGKISHFFYKIFNKKKHNKRLNEYIKTKENILQTDKIIVSSNVLKQDMIDNYNAKEEQLIILPPPIEKYPDSNREKHNPFVFGISAIGFNRKGGYILLKAIKQLKKIRQDFKVVFIYPSKNLGVTLTQKFYGIEKFCEIIPVQKDMNKFYNSIDCLLMPSIIEPFGMVASEALSTGCPVITGSHCGAADYIEDAQNGFTYDYSKKSIKGLVKAMSKMIDMTATDLSNMSVFCKKSVEEQSEEIFVSKFIEIMNTLQKKETIL